MPKELKESEMAEEQIIKSYEVGFSTEKFQHIFYVSCTEDADVKTFAHAVFHYYDTPEDWGRKLVLTKIAEIKPVNCLPDFLHIGMVSREDMPMPEENEESRRAVGKIIRRVMDEGHVPMAIYDEEAKTMTVYATRKLEAAPQEGAASVVLNFSNFGGMLGKKK